VWNSVPQDLLVHCNQYQPLQLRLCHQQPVEGVAMQLRKRTSPLRLLDSNCQGQEVVLLNGFSNRAAENQFPRSLLDRNLPNRYRADKDLITLFSYG